LNALAALDLAALISRLAADSRTHPHAIRADYDDVVAARLDGSTDPDLRAVAESEARAALITKYHHRSKR
jgi:hypothetical protein